MRILAVNNEFAATGSGVPSASAYSIDADAAPDGRLALARLQVKDYDLVLLDVPLTGMPALEFCRRLRGRGDTTAVLVVSAGDLVHERINLLDAGADAFICKPIAFEELVAHMRAIVRRTSERGDISVLQYADISLDLKTLRVERNGRPVDLSPTEFTLLQCFMRNPERLLSRGEIFDKVWGYDFGTDSNSHETYVGYLRRKLEAAGEPRIIHTVRGAGYELREVTDCAP